MEPVEVGGVNTTEICNISCVMCHFNGPLAIRKQATLTPAEVEKYVSSIPPGPLWFASTGEFFMDPQALEHLRIAVKYGHRPCVLTNGQLLTRAIIDQILEIGVRLVTISVDAYEPDSYRKIRRGGELATIMDACRYLRAQKCRYPDLRVEVNNVLFKKTFPLQERFIEFWRGKVDVVNFNAEYYDIFKFRNLFFDPGERVDCKLRVFLLPSGQMAPCCAMTVYQHEHNVEWLPHISNTTPDEALQEFRKMYADPNSPLGKLCQQCDWWVLWKRTEEGENPYFRAVQLGGGDWPEVREVPGIFHIRDARGCNSAVLERADSLVVVTDVEQWSYAALVPARRKSLDRFKNLDRLYVRVEATVERGQIGIGVVGQDLSSFIGPEQIRSAAPDSVRFETVVDAPDAPLTLVIRNTARDAHSAIKLHSINCYRETDCATSDQPMDPRRDFVPLDEVRPVT